MLKLVEHIPVNSETYFVILLHRNGQYKTNLISLLEYHSALKIKEAEDKEPLEKGVIYVAPASYHLLLEKSMTWSLEAGEPIWHCRPAIDVLFDSAADALGKNTCGILLSGANQDGAQGLKRIKEKGGITLIQNLEDAMYPTMPSSAAKIDAVGADFKTEEIAELMKGLLVKSL